LWLSLEMFQPPSEREDIYGTYLCINVALL